MVVMSVPVVESDEVIFQNGDIIVRVSLAGDGGIGIGIDSIDSWFQVSNLSQRKGGTTVFLTDIARPSQNTGWEPKNA